MKTLKGKARRAAIIDMARKFESEGELELDEDKNVKISEGDDNGAYVSMWRWVSFDETPLDKEAPRKPCRHGQMYFCIDCRNETGKHPHQMPRS